MRTDISSIDYDSKGNICQINVITGADILFPDKEAVLMQCTGLKDRHGIDIYEHDIVKILYTDWPSQLDRRPELSHEEYLDSITLTRVVVWSVQGFYVSHKVDGYAESMEPGTHGYIEVIGNVYENP